jgi:glycolate oxidase
MRDEVIHELKSLLGADYVLTAKEDMVLYSYDAQLIEALPHAVVEPANAGDVAAVLKIANRERIPVIPRGAGTGLSAGSVPIKGGIVLSTRRMKRIDIDEKNLTALVEPGVVTMELYKAAKEKGLFYPPDPGSFRVSTIGGNIATNAGGPHALKYGVTRNYVLGLEVVLPTGEVFNTGAATVKSVAGYSLKDLFIGSEGTLGVITRARLRLLPKPEACYTVLVAFDDVGTAAKVVSDIIASGVIPSTLEYMDQVTINAVEDYKGAGLPRDAEAVLLIETDGNAKAAKEEANKIISLCEKAGAKVRHADDPREREKIWQGRRAALPALTRIKPSTQPTTLLEDATVPRSKVPEMVAEIKRISEKYNLAVGVFGHAGDGNLHPTFLTDMRDAAEMERVEKAAGEIFEAALGLGGTLSGEHGIGAAKSKYLEKEVGRQGIEVMRTIKSSLDPNNILNPGKVLPL